LRLLAYRNARAHLLIVLLSTNIVTRAANDGSKWIGGLVQWKMGKFKGMPQKFVSPSPRSVMLDDCEHSF
jgi:hypothetical protein